MNIKLKTKATRGRPEIGLPYTITLSTDDALYARIHGGGAVPEGVRNIIKFDKLRSSINAEIESDILTSWRNEI
jgi:hypothetical protein